MTLPTRRFRIFLMVCAFTGVLTSAPRQARSGPPGVRVTVDKVSVLDVAQDRLQLSFLLTFVTDTDVSVREITFDKVRLNDVPLYVGPVPSLGPARPRVNKENAVGAIVFARKHPLKLHRIEAHIDPENIPSVRIVPRLQFELEGTLRQHFFNHGKFFDTAIYAKLA